MVADELCISLVIPLRNEEQSLTSLVTSINGQTRRPDEIVLVDGGSDDGTLELAHKLTSSDSRYRVVQAGPATPGRGRNVGIAAAAYNWIALTDAGIQLNPNWLQQLARVIVQAPDTRVVYGNYEPITETFFEQCAALAYVPPPMPRPGGRMRGPFIASALIHKEVWTTVGGFPDLRAAEDLIFMGQIEAHGFKIGWAPQALVRWQLQPTLTSTFRRFVLYSRHNVWAGRQRYWHHGVARQYFLALPFLLLAFLWGPLWLVVPVLGFFARTAKTIWQKREGRGLPWLLNPIRFLGVALILFTLDLATFTGWAQALLWHNAGEQPGSFLPTASHES